MIWIYVFMWCKKCRVSFAIAGVVALALPGLAAQSGRPLNLPLGVGCNPFMVTWGWLIVGLTTLLRILLSISRFLWKQWSVYRWFIPIPIQTEILHRKLLNMLNYRMVIFNVQGQCWQLSCKSSQKLLVQIQMMLFCQGVCCPSRDEWNPHGFGWVKPSWFHQP